MLGKSHFEFFLTDAETHSLILSCFIFPRYRFLLFDLLSIVDLEPPTPVPGIEAILVTESLRLRVR
jgi:hypothetical protein